MEGGIVIYGFAFTRRNVSCWTLYGVGGFDHRILLWGKDSIDRYVGKLIEDQPSYVVGMGVYGGKDKDKIRIETECTNRFGREFVKGEELVRLAIKPFVKPGDKSKLAKGMGRHYCNLVSYRIQNLINKGQLKSQYTFLHIPRGFDKQGAVEEVKMMLMRL